MFNTLINIILSVLGCTILLFLIKELIPYIRYLKIYKSQGIKYHYNPFMGLVGALFNDNKQHSMREFTTKMNKEYKNQDLVCFNNHDNTQLTFIINNVDLYKELFAKHTTHVKTINFIEAPFKLGFFMETGKKALAQRAIFSEFFQPENLQNSTKGIRNIVLRHVNRLKNKFQDSKNLDKEGFMDCDFKEFTPVLFSDMVMEILFGAKEKVLIDGIPLPATVEHNMVNVMKIWKNRTNLALGGLMAQCSPTLLKVLFKTWKMKDKIREVIKKRNNTKNEDLGVNLLDMMIKHNRNTKNNDVLNLEQMVDNVMLLLLAGQDTTKNSLEIIMKFLSFRPQIANKIVDEEVPICFKNESDYDTYVNYEKSDYLNSVILESMRLIPTAAFTFPKLVIKDLKLGKYKIKKNSRIFVPLIATQHDEEYFENPTEFNEKRFLPENSKKRPRNAFIPFYSGKRACAGRYIAELLQRMVTVEFLKAFELRDNGKQPASHQVFTHAVKESRFFIRLRK